MKGERRDIKALLFDFDGTIVETEGPAYEAWQEVYAEHGHELEMSVWSGALGTLGWFDPVKHLEGLMGKELPDRSDRIEQRRLRKRQLVEAEGFRAGVESYLEDAAALGLKLAIAIEDSPNGIEAAKAARLFCVAVPNPVTAQLDLSAADLILSSLDEMPLRELLRNIV